MAQVYGGDEVDAVILDSGSAWTRSGWAGDDGPKSTMLSSFVSVVGDAETGERLRKFGDEQIHTVRGDAAEIINPMEDSIVKEWDAAEDLWAAALSDLAPDGKPSLDYLNDKPLMITEQSWNSKESTGKTLTWALEGAGSRAAYVSKVPVCSLFGAGKATGLVIDVGMQTASVTPVIDGLVLHKPSKRSKKAGAFLNEQVAAKIKSKIPEGSEVKPFYEVAGRTLPEGITDSFRNFQLDRLYDEFKERMAQVSSEAASSQAGSESSRRFEFSAGSGTPAIEMSNEEQLALGDTLFEGEDGLSNLVIESIKACDVDARANLMNNIVIVGGTSLVQGLTERLNQDIAKAFPMLKVRIYASGNTLERRNGSWIGGSILGSLGTFHQLWVSKEEYEEVGVDQLVVKRFR